MVKSTIDSLPPFPENLPLAPIARISSFKLFSNDASTAAAVLEACQTYGFFYLDLTDSPSGQALVEESEELLKLSKRAFEFPKEEMMKYHLEKGVSMFGYKAAGTVKKTDKELRPDTTEFWNISKDHFHGIAPMRTYPQVLLDSADLIKDFTKNAHECAMEVLRTLATQLDLPKETFVDLNTFNKPAGDHCRLTHKFPHASDAKAVGLPSHTDFGTVTVLFNWLGGLQIESRTPSRQGEWEYVKPLPGHAVINLGDAMVKFTNGALKSAKHRVVPSPGEQVGLDRYSVVYFVRPCNDSLMKPVGDFDKGTHVKVGGKVSVGEDENVVYTAGEWMVKRAIQMGS
ncbi:Clavaminate synthase-like protein [Tothia fuscella]|uniref:Clavaminate synthase-like protein n=1 Tax=Tothia fuscella TaxID=1048955 RepID=A0A9P4NES6_9PEZI|nr:Clavaminate synthase-like protein [Tothia fuscella]